MAASVIFPKVVPPKSTATTNTTNTTTTTITTTTTNTNTTTNTTANTTNTPITPHANTHAHDTGWQCCEDKLGRKKSPS